MGKKLTHMDSKGQARMVDVAQKPHTARQATATGTIRMKPSTFATLTGGKAKKGDVLAAARIAGIMAAKKTPDIIPLCHPIAVSSIKVDFKPVKSRSSLDITATVRCTGPTGVEMEALTAVSAAALTIYDMLKAVDRGMSIGDISLKEKKGGKSGPYKRAGRK